MALPSPICLINGNATPPAIAVTKGSTVTIALANPAGAQYWSIQCTSTDETSDADTINATLVVNMSNKTATFTAPNDYGVAMIFTSIVGISNVGIDANKVAQPAFATTFKVNVLTETLDLAVFAADEELESNADFGWITIINPLIKNINAIAIAHGTSNQLFDTNSAGNSSEWFTAGGDVTFASHDFTVVGLQGVALPSLVTGFLSYTGSAWSLTTSLPIADLTIGAACQVLVTNHTATSAEWKTFSGDVAPVLSQGGQLTVVGIQGNAFSSNTPLDGQLPIWNNYTSQWVPKFLEPLTPSQIALFKFFPAYQNAVNWSVGEAANYMCWDGRNIWVAGASAQNILKIDPLTGSVVATVSITGEASSLCFDGQYIWAPATYLNKILASTAAITATYTIAGGGIPEGCCFDGEYIWYCDGTNKINKVYYANGTTTSYTLGGTVTGDVCFDGTNIWVTSGDNTITKLLASSGAFVATITIGSSYPAGICFDGTNIWVNVAGSVGDSEQGYVTKILASTGQILATLGIGTNGFASGICFDGTSIWAVNYYGNYIAKIHAHTVTLVGTFGFVGTEAQNCIFDGTNIWVLASNGTLNKL